jgi:hypothetical protein
LDKTLDDDDEEDSEDFEASRLWNERFQGYRGLRISDIANRSPLLDKKPTVSEMLQERTSFCNNMHQLY